MITWQDYLASGAGLQVRAQNPDGDGKRVALVISGPNEVPPAVLVRCGGSEGVINLAGGTLVGDEASQKAQFNYFARMFGGDPELPFTPRPLCIMSGGTRVLQEGLDKGRPTAAMSILEVPGLVQYLHPTVRIRTLGHLPRTGTLGITDDSRFSIIDKGDTNTVLNPDMQLCWMVQQNASDPSGWDADLKAYHELMYALMHADPTQVLPSAQIGWGGGSVTLDEVALSIRYGIPVLLIEGSGRAADGLIHALRGEWAKVDTKLVDAIRKLLSDAELVSMMRDEGMVSYVNVSDPRAAQRWLEDQGFAA